MGTYSTMNSQTDCVYNIPEIDITNDFLVHQNYLFSENFFSGMFHYGLKSRLNDKSNPRPLFTHT